MQPTESQHDQLPRALQERLAAQDRGIPMLTPAIDEALSRQAAAHFANRVAADARPPVAVDRRWAFPAAAAAAILLVALLVLQPQAPDAPLLADDVDGSGRVDILDAFALARRRAADPSAVTAVELDALMARIVSLDTPSEVL